MAAPRAKNLPAALQSERAKGNQMAEILKQKPNCKTEFAAVSKKDFMLAAIRTAHARVQMLALEIAEIGTSLKHDMITAESAVRLPSMESAG
jgi:hypothetical protein